MAYSDEDIAAMIDMGWIRLVDDLDAPVPMFPSEVDKQRTREWWFGDGR